MIPRALLRDHLYCIEFTQILAAQGSPCPVEVRVVLEWQPSREVWLAYGTNLGPGFRLLPPAVAHSVCQDAADRGIPLYAVKRSTFLQRQRYQKAQTQ